MIFTFLLSSSWCSRCRRLRELQATAGLLERFSGSTLNCTGARLVSSVTRLQSTLELRLHSWLLPQINNMYLHQYQTYSHCLPPTSNQYVPLCALVNRTAATAGEKEEKLLVNSQIVTVFTVYHSCDKSLQLADSQHSGEGWQCFAVQDRQYRGVTAAPLWLETQCGERPGIFSAYLTFCYSQILFF